MALLIFLKTVLLLHIVFIAGSDHLNICWYYLCVSPGFLYCLLNMVISISENVFMGLCDVCRDYECCYVGFI